MDAKTVKEGLRRLYSCIPETLPPMGWFLTNKAPEHALMPEPHKWKCMFSYFKRLVEGECVCFSADRAGCTGASCYLGFTSPVKQAGRVLAEKDKFKKTVQLGYAFYDGVVAPPAESPCMVWGPIAQMDDKTNVEVVNLWLNADRLSDLVTLANYDRPTNNNVLIPFASGCQSIWTLPRKEKRTKEPRCVVGCMDPDMRLHLPSDVLSFSMLANRFVEMAENVPGSFLGHRAVGA